MSSVFLHINKDIIIFIRLNKFIRKENKLKNMKKQYLIGLLGVAAVSIPMGTSLLNTTNLSIETKSEKVETGIVLNEEKSNIYVTDDNNSEVSKGDMIDAIELDATYDKEKNPDVTFNNEDSLLIYYSDTSNAHWSVSYKSINKYFADDADGDGVVEGFTSSDANGGDPATFSASIDFENDAELYPYTEGLDKGQSKIWNHPIADAEPYNLSTTGTWTVDGKTKEDEFKIGPISIELGFKDSVVGDANVKDITATSATIEYTAEPGRDLFGNDVTIESATLYDNSKPDGEVLGIQDNSKEGIIKVSDLTPGTDYDKAEVRVKFSNAYWPITTPVEDLITQDAETVAPSVAIDNQVITEDTATIDYTIEQGSNEQTAPYVIKSVQWMTADGLEAFQGSEAITNGETTGTLEIKDLDPGITYDESEILVTFEETADITASISEFTTIALDKEAPTITSSINEEMTTATSVTFDYEATDGQDSHGNPYFLAEVEIFDADYNSMGTLGTADATEAEALALEDSITIEGLEANTTYEGWTMEATFIDSIDAAHPHEVEDVSIETFTTLKDGLGGWAIFGIIVGVVLLVGIIGYAGYYLYKKYAPKKA